MSKKKTNVKASPLPRIEQRYAMGRVQECLGGFAEWLDRECTTENTEISSAERLRMILEGDVELLSTAQLDTRLEDAYDFSHVEKEEVFDSDTYGARLAEARSDAATTKDAIMLGTEAQALKALAFFVKKYGT